MTSLNRKKNGDLPIIAVRYKRWFDATEENPDIHYELVDGFAEVLTWNINKGTIRVRLLDPETDYKTPLKEGGFVADIETFSDEELRNQFILLPRV